MDAKELNDLAGPLLDRIGWPKEEGEGRRPTVLHALVAAGMAACDEQDKANLAATSIMYRMGQEGRAQMGMPPIGWSKP